MTEARRELGHGAWVRYTPGFWGDHHEAMERIAAEVVLRAETLTLFGRACITPRLTAWHGDPGCRYRYSGRRFEPRPWTMTLRRVRDAVVAASGYRFNSVLVNLYRGGNDAMGWHADDEQELGPSPDDIGVASVSLGARRRFLLRPKAGGASLPWALGEGDLLVMGGTLQAHFKHSVPRTRRPVGPRMNLTFRVVNPSSER